VRKEGVTSGGTARETGRNNGGSAGDSEGETNRERGTEAGYGEEEGFPLLILPSKESLFLSFSLQTFLSLPFTKTHF